FQAEDGIRDATVTGVQTCALPIFGTTAIAANSSHHQSVNRVAEGLRITARSPDGIVEAVEASDPAWWMVAVQWHPEELTGTAEEIGRASCREREWGARVCGVV